jgi:hypothetical protein
VPTAGEHFGLGRPRPARRISFLTIRGGRLSPTAPDSASTARSLPARVASGQHDGIHFAGPNSGRDADTVWHCCAGFRPSRRRDSDSVNRPRPLVQLWTGYAATAVRMRAMSVVFSALDQGVVVSRNPDGSYAWSGQYNGAAIKCAVPSDDGKHCVILLDPDASKRQAFENLLCFDRKGTPFGPLSCRRSLTCSCV